MKFSHSASNQSDVSNSLETIRTPKSAKNKMLGSNNTAPSRQNNEEIIPQVPSVYEALPDKDIQVSSLSIFQ
jgi:hypothetical protein